MDTRRYGVERETKLARRRTREEASSEGPAEALLRLQRSAGNRAVADHLQIARQGTGQTAPKKTQPTISIQSEAIATLTFPIRSSYETDSGRTISAPHLDSDAELKLRKAQREHLVLNRVDIVIVEGEEEANMKDVYVRNFDSDAGGFIFDLVWETR